MAFNVYLVTNKVNGKKYVGCTKFSIEKRWNGHVCDATRKNSQVVLGHAIRKHGKDAFEVSLLEECSSIEEMKEAEEDWINELKTNCFEYPENGYNMTNGGDGLWGHQFSEKSRKLMSEARKGIQYSDETKKRISDGHKGLKPSLETRKKMSEAHKGKIISNEARENMSIRQSNRTLEHRKKLSLSRLGKPMSLETREKIRKIAKQQKLTPEQKLRHKIENAKNKKPLLGYDGDGNLVVAYLSIADAVSSTGMTWHTLVPKSRKKHGRFLNGIRYVVSEKTISELLREVKGVMKDEGYNDGLFRSEQ